MLSFKLESQTEKVWLGENPSAQTFANHPPLYHQWRTYNAAAPLIVNTYNTGTGKTKAALLRLLKRASEVGFNQLSDSEDNALLIAPTNELLKQHAEDARKFCQENKLPYRVIPISREMLDSYKNKPGFSEAELRGGAALHAILENNRKEDGSSSRRPSLVVINPDIFYYAFYFCYNQSDRIPLFKDFLSRFNYIIIDEFHYYSPKQFANFLFFMSLSDHYGFIMSQSTKRQFCLLTATPSDSVRKFLEGLKVEIDWITPESGNAEEANLTEEVPALSPVELTVYNSEDLDEGLISLVRENQAKVQGWLNEAQEGAIISSTLWRINHIYNSLKSSIGSARMGRLTGAEKTTSRNEAKGKTLILATPTVDIGYNFDRPNKPRQNIDFLLFDARSSDEFIQRLGRAGRVLGKAQRHIPSQAVAVVSPDFYKALEALPDKPLSRSVLRKLALENLPARHALYAYIQSGAMAEAFLPIYYLKKMTATQDLPDLEELFEKVKSLFGASAVVKFGTLYGDIKSFTERNGFYANLTNLSKAERQKKYHERLQDYNSYQQQQRKPVLSNQAAVDWLDNDLRQYYVQKARYSFRESFQPPQALVNDPQLWFSEATVSLYDALHIAKNYKATWFTTLKEWQQKTGAIGAAGADEALIYCDLIKLRDSAERLQIGFVVAEELSRQEWEKKFLYQTTALYGLKVEALNGSLGSEVLRDMFSERYIPAVVVADSSWCSGVLRTLVRQGQVFSYELRVHFADTEDLYQMVLGTQALEVCAELKLKGCLGKDRRKLQLTDDSPMIC